MSELMYLKFMRLVEMRMMISRLWRVCMTLTEINKIFRLKEGHGGTHEYL